MKSILGEWDRHGYVIDFSGIPAASNAPWHIYWKPTRVSHSLWLGSYISEDEAKAAVIEHRKERRT